MINKYALLLSFTSVAGSLFAQDLVILKDEAGNTVNGQLVVQYGDPSAPDHEVDIIANLQGNVSKTLNVRRYETQVLLGTANYFCWGVCYEERPAGGQYLWQSLPQHAVALVPGVDALNFHAYLKPNGQVGVARFRFVWFDIDQPADTAWVDIEFRSEVVGIDEAVASQYDLAVFPNPSAGADVRVSFAGAAATSATRLVVYNTLGERVHSEGIRASQQAAILSTAALSTGVYFATLEANGITVATRRLVVTGR